MKENDKIHINQYLNDLNRDVEHARLYESLKKDSYQKITCAELAKRCEVTPATISNLSTSSRFFLLHKVAGEILDAYYGYFMHDERKAREENPDEIIYPRDINYVLMYLTSYYTDEWLS